MEIQELLQIAIEEGASDIHLTVGKPPTIRVDGKLISLESTLLESEDTKNYMKSITSDAHQQLVREQGGTDFGFAYGDLARFRVSVFQQKGFYGLVLRIIPSRIRTLEEIGLPMILKERLFKPRGLILVTGPTGSGKTSTLASMIDVINMETDSHILTIEDPIEYFHTHKKGIVNQREVGVDVSSFSEAIKRGLRQDPDVILVGEMRDLETMEAAITAAETGHLVFATLHTTGATQTIDRIIDAFPTNQQEQIRSQLSVCIEMIISQQLLPHTSGRGRIAAFEIMVSTPSIQNLIRDNKTYRITSDLQTGGKYGMQTLDACLLQMFNDGYISYESLITKCNDPEWVYTKLRQAS
ncbi:MAG: type IV pilus twitching motility protein PilT [Candidatus Auribacterota bacterium]|jgi:twitching motility protein PilT|nr:type IV pilus twitching motility protein PilT [Candidatus Auribacterota bacterium]